MRRTAIMVGLLVALSGAGVAGRVAAAEETSNPSNASATLVPQASLDDLFKKLDSIRQHQDDLKNVSKQLEQVLKNQDAIMADLQIIKIRTLHR